LQRGESPKRRRRVRKIAERSSLQFKVQRKSAIDWGNAFLSELRDFEDKLCRAANLHLDPDLNDGVVLNIAPIRELVP
jgi:hypothetical protein